MKPRITMLTIGVDDLERSLVFYRDGLGFPTPGIVGRQFEHGAVAFFDLQPGLKLAIYARDDIAHSMGVAAGPRSMTELMMAHNVRSEAEVDAVMKQAQEAGAVIVRPAHETVWGGYVGYFKDPDDHVWEIAFNPDLLPD
jgi:uncharacterized protein